MFFDVSKIKIQKYKQKKMNENSNLCIHCSPSVFVSFCIAISLSLLRTALQKEVQYGLCYIGDEMLMIV